MSVKADIRAHIASHEEPKRSEMQRLHDLFLAIKPGCKLWFLDGKDASGKVVSNPDIGYGSREHKFAGGKVSEFYQVGLSSNKSGISIYILGIEDKKYLAETYGKDIGKAKVTGYCISFRKLDDINIDVLENAIRFGYKNSDFSG